MISVYAQKSTANSKLPRERLLGDQAFKDGVYDLAIRFYNEYKVKSAGNTDAMLDACKCLISAYVHSGNARKAREEFNYLTVKFAERIAGRPELREELAYWDGNILMEAGDPRKAAETFQGLLKTFPQNKQKTTLYFRILDALGTAYARSLQWAKAEKSFAMLEFAGRKTKWQAIAARKKILSVIMMNDFKTAGSLIHQNAKSKSVDMKVLRCILLLKEGYLDKAFKEYKDIRKSAVGTDPLWYMIASSLADASQEKKQYKNALFVLNDALLFAGSEFDRQRTLVRIINAAISDNNIKAAITTAEKFLKSYPDSFLSNEIRLKLAKLYANNENPEKKPEDAIQVLTTMINDDHARMDMKVKSAREAAHIYINLKRYAAAKDMFQYMLTNGATPLIKGEGAYWIAELQYMQEQYKNAAESFAKVAKDFSEWREKSLFKEIKSLMNTVDYKTTILRLERFIKDYPSSPYTPNANFLYALSLKNAEDKKRAIAQFAKFANTFPNHAYAPRALFEEGLLEMEAGKYQDAVSAFTQLYEKYPENPLVPNALYRRIYGLFWEGFNKEAIADVQILESKYPKSDYTIHAQFRLAEYYLENKEPEKAVIVLKNVAAKYASSNPSEAARAYYEIADIYFQQDNKKEAFEALDELSENFQNEPVSNNGLFLRGEIFTQNNEYEKAIPFFIKAAKSAPGTLLEVSAIGRTGDCYFALGDKVKDGSNYMKAVELYKQILTRKNLPPYYRDQALYKIGEAEEMFGDRGKALLKFRKVMIYYNIDNKLGKATARSSVWFAKSALKAAAIYLDKDNPEAAEAAIAIYNTLIKAGVEPVDDFIKKIDFIKNKYKLKE
jgi:TolA-binding protein